MDCDFQNIFTSMPTIEICDSESERAKSLQDQIISLKRDLEFVLYNLEFGNFSKKLQNRIIELEKGETDGGKI